MLATNTVTAAQAVLAMAAATAESGDVYAQMGYNKATSNNEAARDGNPKRPLTSHTKGTRDMATAYPTDSTIEIQLTRGFSVVVDAIDADLASLKWCAHGQRVSHIYAARKGELRDSKQSLVFLHRVVLERAIGRSLQQGEYADHIDGNTFNNTRSNLRLASGSQNNANQRKSVRNTSGYKGVSYDKRRGLWFAQIRVEGKQLFLGYFDEPVQAGIAYNHAAVLHFAEYASVNDISGWRDIQPKTHKAVYVAGEQHSNHKLTDTQVAEIRQRYANGGVSQSELAREYGVQQRQIGRIVNNKSRVS